MHDIIERHRIELESICKKYNVDIEEAIGRNRKKEFKQARVEVVCLLKHKYHYTYKRLWDAFDWRNHAAILHLVKKCKPKKQYWGKMILNSQVIKWNKYLTSK